MIPDVIEVRYMGGHRVWVAFHDGVAGEVDLAAHLHFRGVFEALQDPRYFAGLHLDPEAATIVWPNGADIDPLTLYAWITKDSIEQILAKDDSPKTHSRH